MFADNTLHHLQKCPFNLGALRCLDRRLGETFTQNPDRLIDHTPCRNPSLNVRLDDTPGKTLGFLDGHPSMMNQLLVDRAVWSCARRGDDR
jgi:hypothetical protein